MRAALERRSASTMIIISIKWSFVGAHVDCSTKTSLPRTFSRSSTITSPSLKRETVDRPSWIFRFNANPRLAQRVAKNLNIQLGRSTVSRFSDGEVMVELLENVRGKAVFVLSSTG